MPDQAATEYLDDDRLPAEVERLTAKVAEAYALADVLDAEATAYPDLPGAAALHSAATRFRGALAYEVHNPLNREVDDRG